MKSLQKLFFVGLGIVFMLSSCTMEKRVYLPGYHTTWNKSKKQSGRQYLASNENGKQIQQIQIQKVVESENDTNKVDNYFASTINDNNVTASVNNNSFIIPSHKTVTFNRKVNTVTGKTNPTSETKTVISNNKVSKNKLKELKANNSSDNNDGSIALRISGIILLFLGLLTLVFASIIVGALAILLGLIFLIVGRKKRGSSSRSDIKPETPQYIDVVYLKNGSIIRGIIIEQTPNISLKVQTSDGNIFFYKMEDVEKMAKELSK